MQNKKYPTNLIVRETKNFKRMKCQNTPLELTNGEGNGIPLQYSCLENPMDGGAW